MLSKRIQSVSPSATIVVSFAAGEPDFDTPDCIKDAAIAALKAGDTKYNPRQGNALLEAIVAKLEKYNGLSVGTDQVVMTFGGKHALYDAFQVTIDEGDGVLIPAPYWVSYPAMVTLAGGTPIFLETSAETNFKITPQQVLDNADKAKVLVLNSPSNPTGVTYTRDELKAIGDAVLQTDLMIFSDEIYERLVYGDAEPTCVASLDPRLAERTLTFNGLAKTYSMTGWRLGWVAGPKELIASIRKLMSHETTNPVSFAQAGALAAYTDPAAEDAVLAMRDEFAKRGQHMAARLNAMDGVVCCEPTGAFYCFPDVSDHFGKTIGGVTINGSMDLAQVALDQANIAVVPGVAFGEDRCVRLSFATSMEQIDKGLDRLETLLK